ncbi:MAG: hypothetical protein A3G34_14165 [Candidatus Lindowbacteria bacterium RIFCSPLOWO2_12_FULL_62_27]|nr:MAG: hypothetical protein A3I06_15850 [Candidatus Lindowbacteria bacterium RIFCSPLOWO2_02_FULL_62_12]OGH62711.1 MAG: hypothetical protein A3G34_14165 [Candidatus Lindowbacteria bacterium RIFCSPLOWO2_12_FULL_62_27]
MESDAAAPDLSISILTWNTRACLKACLDSIRRHTHEIRYEIIVVDNGSTDGAFEMLKQEYPGVRAIRHEENLGFTAGNNVALRAARGRYILLLNSDTVVREGCLDLWIRLMEGDPAVGVSAPKMFYPDGRLYLSIHPRFPDPLCCLSERSILTELCPRSGWVEHFRRRYFYTAESDYASDRDIAWGIGAALMLRRAAVEATGLLDVGFFAFFEEIDYCLRARAAGWRLRYYHQPEVIHISAGSLRQDYDRITHIWHASRFYFYRKHFSAPAMFALKALTATGIVIRLIKLLFRIRWVSTAGSEWRGTFKTYVRILLMSVLYPLFGPRGKSKS